jgi:4-amino-4-deoxy-L-arabinose transferase-like glycosyltransferase
MTRPRAVAMAVGATLAASALLASSGLGLGDAEALYWCHGANLSWSYLDHPPLAGWLIGMATRLGGAHVPAVRAVPLATMLLTVLFTWLLTRDLYGAEAAGWSALLLLALPVFAAGMTAATPDAPLAALWSLYLWRLHRTLAAPDDGSFRHRWSRPLLLGAVLGAAFLAKQTGAMLLVTTLVLVALPRHRTWLRRPGFWLGAVVAATLAIPVLAWNLEHDWAGAQHRLVWTQERAGFSLRNLGALVGGQLLYVGPITLPLLLLGARAVWRGRREHPERLVLLAAAVPTLLATWLLMAWSRVAEPHWAAPGYLALVVAAAGMVAASGAAVRRTARAAVGIGLFALLALHVAVRSPLLPALLPDDTYEPKYDLANELRGWPEVAAAIRELEPAGRPVTAGFYTQCAQLAFALSRPGDPEVRCVSARMDDFDIWHGPFALPPQGAWFVDDNRFDHDPERLVPGSVALSPGRVVEIRRGGRVVRRFTIRALVPRGSQAYQSATLILPCKSK